ncbi:glycosyl hydrolase family 28-related protein [Streptomyces sp. BE230]|uniref:glycosyl hydrolase family 28-related protein n=1 Tax=Streptomyces sp. BE230 TaxID=3002526 RepID=UPI002ED3AD3C|nr:glycosyl hydrolase family 28-related protein [Streptomyces sp. BE230]
MQFLLRWPVLAGAARAAAETVVEVAAFGADPTGRSDSAAAVAKAVRHAGTIEGPVRIVFPHGTYRIYPEQAEVRELYVSNTVGADQSYKPFTHYSYQLPKAPAAPQLTSLGVGRWRINSDATALTGLPRPISCSTTGAAKRR